jgi:hypothetical protein
MVAECTHMLPLAERQAIAARELSAQNKSIANSLIVLQQCSPNAFTALI